jgi:hypothetical protein
MTNYVSLYMERYMYRTDQKNQVRSVRLVRSGSRSRTKDQDSGRDPLCLPTEIYIKER